MVVLGRVENVREWWDRIAGYWLRRPEEKKGTLLQLAKIHARLQCVHLPPQPSWPKDLFTKGASSAYFEAVIETMKQNKVSSVPEPSLGRVKASHQRKRSPLLTATRSPLARSTRIDGERGAHSFVTATATCGHEHGEDKEELILA